jgi:hypothetical protein
MRKVNPETLSKIQQSGIGTDSTNPVGDGLAIGRSAVRITPAGADLKGVVPVNLTVAFIGLSGVAAIRAFSLRGAAGAATEAGGGGKEVGGFRAIGGGGRGVLIPDGSGSSGAFVSELAGSMGGVFNPVSGGAGRTMLDGKGAGGRATGGAGGRSGDLPAAGGIGFGATNGGGGRTRGGAGDVELDAGGRAAPGGRTGKLIRAGSFSTGTAGRCVVHGGKVMRTVSFFGSFNSAILL